MRNIKIRNGELELAARAAGDSDKPALVLLHGWPQSSQLFEPVIDRLGEDGFVLAFDLPAVGASRGAPPSAEKSALADLILTAAEEQGAISIIVAGLDVGGMIAFAAARDHAARNVGAVGPPSATRRR
jgi:pimeloyl-ACP methyl ester carboxylesterase